MIKSVNATTLGTVYISIILSNVESSSKKQILCLQTGRNIIEKITLFNSLTHTHM